MCIVSGRHLVMAAPGPWHVPGSHHPGVLAGSPSGRVRDTCVLSLWGTVVPQGGVSPAFVLLAPQD